MSKNNEKFYCTYSNHIQLFYKIELSGNTDDVDDIIEDLDQQKALLPDLLNAFQTSFMGKTFPLNEDQLPKEAIIGGHNISFDKELGIVLCLGFYIDSNTLCSTEKTKDVLNTLQDEIDGQFEDGWGENGFFFEQVDKPFYTHFRSRNLAKIVAPVQGYSAHFNVKWPSIDAIENINWMLYHDNGAYDMLYKPEYHAKVIESCEKVCKEYGIPVEKDYNMQRYNYVKEHLDRFFLN